MNAYGGYRGQFLGDIQVQPDWRTTDQKNTVCYLRLLNEAGQASPMGLCRRCLTRIWPETVTGLADLSGGWSSGLRTIPSRYVTHLRKSQRRASSWDLCLLEFSPGDLNSVSLQRPWTSQAQHPICLPSDWNRFLPRKNKTVCYGGLVGGVRATKTRTCFHDDSTG